MSELSIKDFDLLSEQEKTEALALLERYDKLEKQESCKKDFMSFVKHMWPGFIEGRHHKIVAEKFNKIATGKLKRLIVCMPPRHSKSEFASIYLPAWMIGQKVNLKLFNQPIQPNLLLTLAVKLEI